MIGYSNSGKTHLIEISTKLLKQHLNFNTAVIKNIHEHKIDKEGKDTYRFINAGAIYAITRNIYYETTIFTRKELSIIDLIKWLKISPLNIDIIFIEGFRELEFPTILCIKDIKEIEEQINENIKMISGIICKESNIKKKYSNLPLIGIDKNFDKFLQIFNINQN